MRTFKINGRYKCIVIFILLSVFFLINGMDMAQALEVGEKIPLFVLKNTEGKEIKMILNEKNILSFIHYSSEKCKEMLFFLNKLEKKNTNIISVNVGPDKDGDLKKLISLYKLKHEVLLDPQLEAIKAYQILILPTVFLVDERGGIKKKIVGFDQNIANTIRAF